MRIELSLAMLAVLMLTLSVWASAGQAGTYGGGAQSIVSCRDVCVVKAAAPKPGQRPQGHIVRQCFNTLTGQYVGDQTLPFRVCSR